MGQASPPQLGERVSSTSAARPPSQRRNKKDELKTSQIIFRTQQQPASEETRDSWVIKRLRPPKALGTSTTLLPLKFSVESKPSANGLRCISAPRVNSVCTILSGKCATTPLM